MFWTEVGSPMRMMSAYTDSFSGCRRGHGRRSGRGHGRRCGRRSGASVRASARASARTSARASAAPSPWFRSTFPAPAGDKRWRIRSIITTDWENTVAAAAPVTPSEGNGPIPRIISGSRVIFRRSPIRFARNGVAESPWAVNSPVRRNVMKKKTTSPPVIRI